MKRDKNHNGQSHLYIIGNAGEQGVIGATGATGGMGSLGATGATGVAGVQGEQVWDNSVSYYFNFGPNILIPVSGM